jgi:hypothetical protein
MAVFYKFDFSRGDGIGVLFLVVDKRKVILPTNGKIRGIYFGTNTYADPTA